MARSEAEEELVAGYQTVYSIDHYLKTALLLINEMFQMILESDRLAMLHNWKNERRGNTFAI